MKKDTDAEFWPRLLKDKTKEKNQVTIDWSRYVDEDEEKEGFDMSSFGPGAMVWKLFRCCAKSCAPCL
jgi:hypothetical protein